MAPRPLFIVSDIYRSSSYVARRPARDPARLEGDRARARARLARRRLCRRGLRRRPRARRGRAAYRALDLASLQYRLQRQPALSRDLLAGTSCRGRMMPRRRFLLIAACLALAVGLAPLARAQLASFPKSELTIDTASGKRHFAIEEARSNEQMMQGLMYRR